MHAHHGHHHHAHSAGRAGNRRRMAIALGINVLLLVVGAIGAVVFGSVALLADAGHVLSDVGAIALGLLAAAMATRPARGRRTFGLHRGEIIAALANGLLLVAVAVLVFAEAIGRLSDPPSIEAGGVLAVGLIGLAGNAAATAVLIAGDRKDLNLEGVLRHSAADALGSLGVVVSAVVVLATDWRYADPIAGLLIGLLVLAGSWGLVRDAFDVLMEAAPAGIDVTDVGRAMAGVPGVREVHDLHVWTVTAGFPALAAHVRVDPTEDLDEVRTRVEAVLHERYDIQHTTLQMMAERLLSIEDRRTHS
ncbi:MAG: cobalt-zinc-cadmium efflux system protein [Thermoleophilaceae bacterium]|jgi:cobalt-zinc-cadmium efflux system protein|nr:cobalt-zinc-cadmium efflux system protein [Thermoleophilaceae bacterium]